MAVYPLLASMMAGANIHSSHVFETRVIPYLLETWLDDYRRFIKASEILETSVDGFSYLFDATVERLIAAWGVSSGRMPVPATVLEWPATPSAMVQIITGAIPSRIPWVERPILTWFRSSAPSISVRSGSWRNAR